QALDAGRRRFGRLEGVIHAAGIVKDAFAFQKTRADAEAVLAPKIAGALCLDELTKDDNLDFFVLFSSVVAKSRNVRQADYAFANAFLGGFATLREHMRSAGTRAGRTIAIDWGAWSVGMKASSDTLGELKSRGISLIDESDGGIAFEAALGVPSPEVVVI